MNEENKINATAELKLAAEDETNVQGEKRKCTSSDV